MGSIIPPPNTLRGGVTGTTVGGFLAWVAYTLIELQTGQARIEERIGAHLHYHTTLTAVKTASIPRPTAWTSPAPPHPPSSAIISP